MVSAASIRDYSVSTEDVRPEPPRVLPVSWSVRIDLGGRYFYHINTKKHLKHRVISLILYILGQHILISSVENNGLKKLAIGLFHCLRFHWHFSS